MCQALSSRCLVYGVTNLSPSAQDLSGSKTECHVPGTPWPHSRVWAPVLSASFLDRRYHDARFRDGKTEDQDVHSTAGSPVQEARATTQLGSPVFVPIKSITWEGLDLLPPLA